MFLVEEALCQHSSIMSAIAFGHSRSCLGVIVELKDSDLLDRDDKLAVQNFIDALW